jgi:hypothetical protein
MPRTDPPSRSPALATTLCFVLPFGLYCTTAARTVQGGDSGELALVGLIGGVAHPPGYPLYSLLARLGAVLPLGPPFFRVALVSAVCGAGAVAAIQRVAWRMSGDLFASVAAALLFAVAPIPWRLAGIPEVFALHSLLTALVVLCALRLAESASDRVRREAFLLGLVGGLALSNHLTILWCAPVVVWGLWRGAMTSQRWLAVLLATGVGGLLGLTPYLTLPVFARSAGPNAIVWGHFDTLSGFADHVLRKQYGTLHLSGRHGSSTLHIDPLVDFLRSAAFQYSYLFFFVALIGVVLAVRRGRPAAFALLLSLLLAGPLFASLFNFEPGALSQALAQRFHLMPVLLMVPFIAIALAGTATRLGRVLPAVVGVALFGLLVHGRWAQVDWTSDRFIQSYVTEAVNDVEPDAVIIGSTDTLFGATPYVTQALRVRPDVHYVDINMARLPWYRAQLQREIPRFPEAAVREPWRLVLALAASQHPTYVLVWDEIDRTRLATEPHGLVDRVVRPGRAEVTDAHSGMSRVVERLIDRDSPPIDAHSAVLRELVRERSRDLDKRSNAGLPGE